MTSELLLPNFTFFIVSPTLSFFAVLYSHIFVSLKFYIIFSSFNCPQRFSFFATVTTLNAWMYNVVNQISTTEMYIKQMLKINEILENSRKKKRHSSLWAVYSLYAVFFSKFYLTVTNVSNNCKKIFKSKHRNVSVDDNITKNILL